MNTRPFLAGLFGVVLALSLGPAAPCAEPAPSDDAAAKKLLATLTSGDAKREIKLEDLLRALLSAFDILSEAKQAAAQIDEPVPPREAPAAPQEAPAPQAPSPEVSAAGPRSALQATGLRTSSLQPATGVDSAGRGMTSEAEWRQMFPKR